VQQSNALTITLSGNALYLLRVDTLFGSVFIHYLYFLPGFSSFLMHEPQFFIRNRISEFSLFLSSNFLLFLMGLNGHLCRFVPFVPKSDIWDGVCFFYRFNWLKFVFEIN